MSLGQQLLGSDPPCSIAPRSIHHDVLSIALLTLLPLIVFSRDLFLGMKVMETDTLTQGIPTMAWFGQTVRSGESFLWTRGIIGGFPIGFSQYGMFSPFEWIGAAILDSDRAYALMRVLHLPLAGVSTYLYARVMGLSPLPSLLAGVGYELSTDALAIPIHGNGSKSLFFLSTFLLSVELAIRVSPRWWLLGAGGVGFSMLTGGPFITAIGLLNSAFYVLARVSMLWRSNSRKNLHLMMLSSGGAVTLGMGLAALRILPTSVVTAESIRAQGTSLAVATSGSQGILVQLAGYLLPLTGLKELSPQEFYVPSYVGPIVLVLAGLSVLDVRRNPMVPLLSALFAFNLLASMGSHSPVFGLLHQLPLLGYFRGAFHFSFIAAFFLSMLAAYTLDRGFKSIESAGWAAPLFRLLAMASTAAVALAIVAGALWVSGAGLGAPIREFAESHRLGPVNPLRPRIALALVAIPAAFWLLWARCSRRIPHDLPFRMLAVGITAVLLVGVGMNLPMRQEGLAGPPATALFLAQDKPQFRILSHNTGMAINLILVMLAGGDPGKVNDEGPAEQNFSYRYSVEALASSFPLQYGLESIDGYEPLQSIRQLIALAYLGSNSADIQSFGWGGKSPENRELADKLGHIRSRHLLEHLPVLRAFNVKYVLTNLELWRHSDVLRLAYSSQIPMLDAESKTTIHVYEVLDALPRAYLVPHSLTVGGPMEALEAIMSGDVDSATTALLEETDPLQSIGPRLDPANSRVDVASYTNTHLLLHVKTSGAGFLVINDAFYPGWEAWIDGQKSRILVANGWVRAIPIESPGTHVVQLNYTPPLFAEGIWVSLTSLVVFVAALVVPLPASAKQAYS